MKNGTSALEIRHAILHAVFISAVGSILIKGLNIIGFTVALCCTILASELFLTTKKMAKKVSNLMSFPLLMSQLVLVFYSLILLGFLILAVTFIVQIVQIGGVGPGD